MKLFFILLFAFFTPTFVFAIDTDVDGLDDADEERYYTNPAIADTDGDGFSDGVEVQHGYSPVVAGKKLDETDYDNDGLRDDLEIKFGSDMGKADTDGDLFKDYDEVMSGYSPIEIGTSTYFQKKIVVDLSQQQLHYTIQGISVLTFPVSTGILSMPTPTGSFTVNRKIPVTRYVAATYNLPNVKWNLEFKPKYFIHTAYWHNDFGIKPRSHGCVNMREADAALLYTYVGVGTPVEIVGKTPKKALL